VSRIVTTRPPFAYESVAGSVGAFVGPLLGSALAVADGFPAALVATGRLLLALVAGLAVSFHSRPVLAEVPGIEMPG
jgi:hypothetical protein